MSSNKITVTPDRRSDPNLRKLARALLSLARRELEAETKHTKARPAKPQKAVQPDSGDAA